MSGYHAISILLNKGIKLAVLMQESISRLGHWSILETKSSLKTKQQTVTNKQTKYNENQKV